MVLSYDCQAKKAAATNKCTSVVGHFDGHGGVPVPYGAHRLMQHDQGFIGSHWMPPLGNYLLRIAPTAARATANETTIQHVPTWLAISMAVAMRRYYTSHITRWRRFVAFIKATKRHHRASTRSDIIKGTRQRRLFRLFHREIGLQLTCWPLITIGV